MAMNGPKALLYIPVKVEQKTSYKITIEASRYSGNGIIYCNIYGNKNFDFPQNEFTCDSEDWTRYTFEIKTGLFPKTIPMIFRLWRKPKGTGTILVRRISVEMVKKEKLSNKIISNIPMVDKNGKVMKEALRPIERKAYRKPKPPYKPPRTPPYNPKPRRIVPGMKSSIRVKTENLPILQDLVPGEDGIKNSVIISVKDREEYLHRTLYSYSKQTMPKNEFELVIVDDGSKDDLLSLCKRHAKSSGLQFQYIRVDTKKGAVFQEGFTPALTNNIGFKNARGSVLIVTGPETLQSEVNMVQTWESCKKPRCIYGYVYKSGLRFTDYLKKNKSDWHKYKSFNDILKIDGAMEIEPDITGFWWYYAAARKEYILGIRGVDERFMKGICGEDDDFANRLRFYGVQLIHNKNIVGIHQNHYSDDRRDTVHNIRFNKRVWNKMRKINSKYLAKTLESENPIANKHIDWGTSEAIIDKEIF